MITAGVMKKVFQLCKAGGHEQLGRDKAKLSVFVCCATQKSESARRGERGGVFVTGKHVKSPDGGLSDRCKGGMSHAEMSA